MDEPKIPNGNLPLRVNQLDAEASDEFIHEIILEKLRDVLKYLQLSNIFTSYQLEVDAAIKFGLWWVVFRKQRSTLGQQLLDLEYTSVRPGAKTLSAITRVQSLLYLICNVVTPYLWARLRELQAIRSFSDSNPHLDKLITILQTTWQYVNLLNFVTFLYNGQFLHVYERICGMRSFHPKGKQLREVGFEFSNREIMWHGFTEFMTFLLPYINMRKVKTMFTFSSAKSSDGSKFCKECDSYPTNPTRVADCSHIYCYHCAASLVTTDGALECKACNVKITSLGNLERAQHLISLVDA
ncbi:PEX2 [Bugula neritina]|uniref:RING-type E3 ubiquitin transferase (cysteine targeting) n=1 Tax=Bugula neritina TaxID=10212 RepID=A0A7J7JLW0_BUGNE|nr:PEX2 [Bugula neritina]